MRGQRASLEPFRPRHQRAARTLILRGLAEHFGEVDEGLNPDLDDIGDSYAPGHFALAWLGSALVATGGFVPRSASCVQIHRVSVAPELRREGLGSLLVAHLLDVARSRGFERAMLETTATWTGVISFYERLGFEPFERREGDLYLALDL